MATVNDGELPNAPVGKSENELRRELEELERQQQQINERLRESIPNRRYLRAAGRGGPAGGPGASNWPGGDAGPPFRTPGGRGFQRGVVRTFEETGLGEEQPARKRRLSSAVVKVNNSEAENLVGNGQGEETEEDRGRPLEGRKFYDGSRFSGRHAMDAEPMAPVPRVLPVEHDPKLTRRNRRMFGALLLGTLEKFKEEDKKLQGSDAYLRRNFSLQKAEQRKMEESERLRQQERKEAEERRKKDLTLRARLAAKAEEKQLELLYLQWASHRERLSMVLRTRSKPSIFFQPAQSCEATDLLLEEQQKELEDWRQSKRAEMQQYCAAVQDEYLANVEKELERWRTGEAPFRRAHQQSSVRPNEGMQEQGERQEQREESTIAGEDMGPLTAADDEELGEGSEPVVEEEKEASGAVEDLGDVNMSSAKEAEFQQEEVQEREEEDT